MALLHEQRVAEALRKAQADQANLMQLEAANALQDARLEKQRQLDDEKRRRELEQEDNEQRKRRKAQMEDRDHDWETDKYRMQLGQRDKDRDADTQLSIMKINAGVVSNTQAAAMNSQAIRASSMFPVQSQYYPAEHHNSDYNRSVLGMNSSSHWSSSSAQPINNTFAMSRQDCVKGRSHSDLDNRTLSSNLETDKYEDASVEDIEKELAKVQKEYHDLQNGRK